MPNCCSAFGRKDGHKTQPYDGHFYRFSSEKGKCQTWIDSLPDANFVWSKSKRICDVHWPPNEKFTRVKGQDVPDEPPTIFPGVPSSCLRQTAASSSRDVNTRRVSQEARSNAQEDIMTRKRLEDDEIRNWESFIGYCHKVRDLIVIPKQTTSPRSVSLLRLTDDSPPSIVYSIEITERFDIICYLSATKIPVLKNSFEKRLTKYSQFENILSSLEDQ